ncbi:hypothetical protein [Azospirillum sp. sgz302134]
MTVLDFNVVKTAPGEGEQHPFAPPSGWSGDAEAYRSLMRTRFKKDRMHGQRMACIARYAMTAGAQYLGPFAAEARAIVEALKPKKTASV